MPLPVIIATASTIAATAGLASGISGAKKMKDANDTIKEAETLHQKNISKYEIQNKNTCYAMDKLGIKELEILESFKDFSEIFEKIHSKPEFKAYRKSSIHIPKYNKEELKEVYIGAGVLLGGISGAAAGTAGGFAAAGATTAAVMTLGTASTGTAIASLSGAAATNATLAALGGGAVAAGGGGIALGTTILGTATLGVGLLVGGIIFNFTGSKLSSKADEAWEQMKKAEYEINKVYPYLQELETAALSYTETLSKVNRAYSEHLRKLRNIINIQRKNDWNLCSDEEKLIVENTVLLVNLLYHMCKINFVKQNSDKEGINKINYREIDKNISDAKICLNDIKRY